jgi:SM-20-related protein
MTEKLLSEEQLDALAQSGWICIDNFLNEQQVENLLADIHYWQEQDAFKQAGVGKLITHQVNTSYRKDKIKWINPENCLPATKVFIEKIKLLMGELNEGFFLSLKDFECHYAYYDKGDFYKRHSDQFNAKAHRIISTVLYLNKDWESESAGELVLYQNEKPITIKPLSGRLMLFKSEIEHEVLPTKQERNSITGWLKDQYNDVNFL